MAHKKRPDTLEGKTEKVLTGCGNLYITINKDEKSDPCEVRLQIGKSGSCVRSLLEVIGIQWSIMLQHIEKDVIVKSLKKNVRGVSCGQEFRLDDKRYSSCIDKIAQRMLVEMKEEE